MKQLMEVIHSRAKNVKFTKAQKKIMDYLENSDCDRIIFFTITEFAREVGTGEATVLRFCRVLGFEGYQVFKLYLAQELRGSELGDIGSVGYQTGIYNVYLNSIANCMKKMSIAALDDICSYIIRARNISCFGAGSSHIAAVELHNRLLKMGIASSCESDIHIQNALVSAYSAADLVIIFSVSGSTKDVVEIVKIAKTYGAVVVLVTAHESSPLAKQSNLVISTGTSEVYGKFETSVDRVVQIYLVDSICERLYSKDSARFDLYINRSRSSTVNKLI